MMLFFFLMQLQQSSRKSQHPSRLSAAPKAKVRGELSWRDKTILVLLLRNDSCLPLGKEEEARLAASRSSSPCPIALSQSELPEQRSGEDSCSCCRAPRRGLMIVRARRLFRLVQQPSKAPCCGIHSSSFLLIRSSLQDPSQSHIRSSPLAFVLQPILPMIIVTSLLYMEQQPEGVMHGVSACRAKIARKRADRQVLPLFTSIV